MPKVEEHSERTVTVEGWEVKLTSYKLGSTYFASAQNISPGAWIAKGQGVTKREAEDKALTQAKQELARIRKPAPKGCTSVPGF